VDGNISTNSKRRTWEGGYVRKMGDGRDLFVIERRLGKKRFHISTRTHHAKAAYEHLKRFEADPFAYEQEMMEGGRASSTPLRITTELVLEFRKWLLTRDRPTTSKYANEMAHRLADWTEDLKSRDLRRLSLPELKEIIANRKTCRQHRIIALKAFCNWLRTEKHILDRKDDVTLDLAVPQAVPEKRKRRKAVALEVVRAVLDHLAPAYRDCLYLQCHTGWHTTELARFARDPESRIAPGRDGVLCVLQVQHKNGDTTRTPVTDPEAFAAATRIVARGGLPRRMNTALKAACAAAGVPRFTFGVMRHTVATWAVEAGSRPEDVSAFLNHRSKRTTEQFYIDVAVPTLMVKLPRL
jgi:integrase